MEWYLARYYATPDDPGLLQMFCDPARVGAFAVSRGAIRRGESEALFTLLVTVAMFQRRQDVQIFRILRGISPRDARELTSATRLSRLVRQGGCPNAVSAESLHGVCDLTKRGGLGACAAEPVRPCALKRHTVLLRRYGHFGKMPTSAALVAREAGRGGLRALHERVVRDFSDPLERARALEAQVTRVWRVSDKLAAMYLSALTNPDLGGGLAPWTEGLDWAYFVVIDSNVDLFLRTLGYRGAWTYEARRSFIQALAARIDLARLSPGLQPYNPRLVQQAMYLFMSVANRRAVARDCMHQGPSTCAPCPLARECPARCEL